MGVQESTGDNTRVQGGTGDNTRVQDSRVEYRTRDCYLAAPAAWGQEYRVDSTALYSVAGVQGWSSICAQYYLE